MDISVLLQAFMGWPLIIYVVGASLICTIACGFVQIRYFFKSWSFTLFPEEKSGTQKIKSDMTPFQAFLSTLNSSLGNGAIAGMGTALYAGGPGAAFWLLVTSFLTMSIRFAETFLAAYFGSRQKTKTGIGGPMLYLREVVGGRQIAYLYGLFVFIFGLVAGNSAQTNSVREGLAKAWGVPYLVSAVLVLIFIFYVLFGGASRIIKVTDFIVPIKVGVFLFSSSIVLVYHYQSIVPALQIIFTSAFSSHAVKGGVMGFAVQQAVRFGMMRSVFATESGLGSAAILFGASGAQDPVRTGIMSMLASFISTCFCFIVGLCIVASGVWTTGFNGVALTIASFNTTFGQFGGWIVSFLTVSFGIGVLVTFAYISREAWKFLTGGRLLWMHTILYCLFAFVGALIKVDFVWFLSDIAMTGMLLLNLFGIVYLLPVIRKELRKFNRAG